MAKSIRQESFAFWAVATYFVFLAVLVAQPSQGQTSPCAFDAEALTYEGPAREQAQCLLRTVKPWGHVSADCAASDRFLDRAGQPVGVTLDQLTAYLEAEGIEENDLGGPIAEPLSRARSNDPESPAARYFVIHDTSTPNYETDDFPEEINTDAWRHNELGRWQRGNDSVAHVFANRLGESASALPFSRAWRATKLEVDVVGVDSRGLFLHVELVQPRRSRDEGHRGNDALAPEPGFTAAQYDRLALLYLAASVRRGDWMVPAFHAVVDMDRPDGHDDPQAFDMGAWEAALEGLQTRLVDESQ